MTYIIICSGQFFGELLEFSESFFFILQSLSVIRVVSSETLRWRYMFRVFVINTNMLLNSVPLINNHNNNLITRDLIL